MLAWLGLSGTAMAGDVWFANTAYQFATSSYGDQATRDMVMSHGLNVNLNYLERFGMSLNYQATTIEQQSNLPDFEQTEGVVGIYYNCFADSLKGKIGTHLDYYIVDEGTSDVTAYAADLSFLRYDKKYFLNLGVAQSSYTGLEVDQLSFTAGFAFNQYKDWLQAAFYSISTDNVGSEDRAGAKIKWQHWPDHGNFLKLNNFFITALAGERTRVVDNEAKYLNNITDIETGNIQLGAVWRFSNLVQVTLLAGQSEYTVESTNADYSISTFCFNINKEW